MTLKSQNMATVEQVRNNRQKAKEIVSGRWAIFGLQDGNFKGSGYGWELEEGVTEGVTESSFISEFLCVCKPDECAEGIYLNLI